MGNWDGLATTTVLLGNETIGVEEMGVLVNFLVTMDCISICNDERSFRNKVTFVLIILVVYVRNTERDDQVPPEHLLAHVYLNPLINNCMYTEELPVQRAKHMVG